MLKLKTAKMVVVLFFIEDIGVKLLCCCFIVQTPNVLTA